MTQFSDTKSMLLLCFNLKSKTNTKQLHEMVRKLWKKYFRKIKRSSNNVVTVKVFFIWKEKTHVLLFWDSCCLFVLYSVNTFFFQIFIFFLFFLQIKEHFYKQTLLVFSFQFSENELQNKRFLLWFLYPKASKLVLLEIWKPKSAHAHNHPKL